MSERLLRQEILTYSTRTTIVLVTSKRRESATYEDKNQRTHPTITIRGLHVYSCVIPRQSMPSGAKGIAKV
jgi:hypothetical protein